MVGSTCSCLCLEALLRGQAALLSQTPFLDLWGTHFIWIDPYTIAWLEAHIASYCSDAFSAGQDRQHGRRTSVCRYRFVAN